MRLRVHFKEEQDFKVDLKQSNTVLHSDFGEITTIPENNYNNLINKPSINGVELVGNKTGEDLDLGSAVFPSGGSAGDVLGIDDSNQIAWLTLDSGTVDYNELLNKPQINGITLGGDQSAADLGLGTYTLPSGGIPASDLSAAVQASLSAANSAYMLPSGGIPVSNLSESIQASLSLADSALQSNALDDYRSAQAQDIIDSALQSAIDSKYELPSDGIPASDLAAAVQSSLILANTALQSSALEAYRTASAQDSIDSAQDITIASKYTLPSDGIPASDLAATVQSSLNLANTALQSSALEAYRTSDAQDVIDTALQSAIDSKYELPQNGIPKTDLSSAVQSSLDLADTALQPSSIDSALSDQSTNPVQNKVIKQALDNVTSAALPSGGEAGQILMKTSNVDYVTEWVSPANQMEQDNTRPITSGAVYTTVGNIQQLLALI